MKRYLGKNRLPPEDYKVQIGPRGGRYYKIVLESGDVKILLKKIRNKLYYLRRTEKTFTRTYYKGSADLILKEGKCYVGNEKFSQDEQKIIKKCWIEKIPHWCFSNTSRFVNEALFSNFKNVEYVEGYATKKEYYSPIEHAWATINGKVFDPTWSDQENIVYFGVLFDPREVFFLQFQENRETAGMIDIPELGSPMLYGNRAQERTKACKYFDEMGYY